MATKSTDKTAAARNARMRANRAHSGLVRVQVDVWCRPEDQGPLLDLRRQMQDIAAESRRK